MTRRNPISGLLLLGFGLMLGAAMFGGGGTAATLVAAPVLALGFVLKVMLFLVFFSFLAKAFGRNVHQSHSSSDSRHHGGPPWMRPDFQKAWDFRGSRDEKRPPEDEKDRPTTADRFEDWHRMAHAREEVDDYAPPVED